MNIIVESVKSVDNSNIVTLSINCEMPFEELVAMKDMLARFKGGDPLVLKLKDENKEVRILSDSHFWVEASNELVHAINANFANKVDITIKSLDE